jgi:hypothetical protein
MGQQVAAARCVVRDEWAEYDRLAAGCAPYEVRTVA